ncbi:protein kinase [Marinicella sp. W31]|uniref:protein kinase domain-containing protein n=1 Tax=Marinicella sp. W31 TaxID=3023713 RepID=UPI003756E81E
MAGNRFNLNTKLTLMTSLLIIATVVISVLITVFLGNRIGRESVQQKLSASQTVQQAFTEQRALELELISLLVASDPAFVAYIAQATYDIESAAAEPDVASISDLLLERKQDFGFDIALVATADGKQLARSDQSMAVSRDLNDKPLLQEAIQELVPVNGYWQENDALYQAAIVPLARAQNLIGFLITGKEVNDALAIDIGQVSSTEVIIATGKDKISLKPVASTMDLNATVSLMGQLKDSSMQLNDRSQQNLSVNGLQMAVETSQLGALAKGESGHIISSASIDQTLRPFVSTRNIMMAVGAAMILLSLLSAIFLVRRALSPIGQLSEATEKLAQGNYQVNVPKSGNDELSQLSGSIEQLVVNLRGKEDISRHLVEISKKVPNRSVATTVSGGGEAAQSVIQPGKVIGSRFEIVEKIGSGGMGVVFKAMDRELDEIVAMKVLKNTGDNPEDVQRFKDEIRLARRITHPNVVRIHDFGQLGKNVFISMEFVQGYTIQQMLKYAKKLRPFAALHASVNVAKGLAAAHEAGIVHRDLKPANLIVELDSTVKLMDFGIATVGNTLSKHAISKHVEGTVEYVSPEQAQGKGTDQRTDIYALGILMMEMFVGKRPFYAEDDEQLMMKHLHEEPTPISEYWVDAPPELEHIILKCLAKRPSDRYQSVQALMFDLERIKLQ